MPFSPGNPPVQARRFGERLAFAVARVDPRDEAAHAAIATAWLAGAEPARSDRFLVPHARADFLAGRVAAKSAARILRADLPLPAAFEIRAGGLEPPEIAHVLPGSQVTIAHSGGLGLACVHAATMRCGVDLEAVERDASEAIATQVTAGEIAWARAGGDEEAVRWLLLWTAREARGKSFGTGLLESGRLAPTEAWTAAPPGWRARFLNDDAMIARSVLVGGFVVTAALRPAAEADAIAAWLTEVLDAPGTPPSSGHFV